MPRKRLTQVFPGLLSLRKKQRLFCFYLGMRMDGNRYAETREKDTLPHIVYASTCPMYNPDTGFDMIYQENKVFNIKLAAQELSRVLIRPGETFSFWHLVRWADKRVPYKDALMESDGRLKPLYGGGLCQLSNLLFWLFLHTHLTILERHGHAQKGFPEPQSDAPMGVDATVYEGWLDLKARNDTAYTFQLDFSFSETEVTGSIRCRDKLPTAIAVSNENLVYRCEQGGVFEEVDVVQTFLDQSGKAPLNKRTLYRNRCRINYPIPEDWIVTE